MNNAGDSALPIIFLCTLIPTSKSPRSISNVSLNADAQSINNSSFETSKYSPLITPPFKYFPPSPGAYT